MIYIFGIYVVISGLVIAYLIWAVLEMASRAREDVDKLEKRLIVAMDSTEVLVADAMDDEPPKPVEYMDDERMAELDRRA